MLPVIALVGRPNVGKSTLFNVLTGTRDAIVADVPGLTRDRQYGYGRLGPVPTSSSTPADWSRIRPASRAQMRAQTERAVAEADRLVLLADARAGLTPQDYFVARELRRSGKPVTLVLNKAEGLDAGRGRRGLSCARDWASRWPSPRATARAARRSWSRCSLALQRSRRRMSTDDAIRIAIIGRPNVGKSTLVNRLLGEERVIASEEPGTTRDSILVPFERDGRAFLLIDTAGVRRRAKVEDDSGTGQRRQDAAGDRRGARRDPGA